MNRRASVLSLAVALGGCVLLVDPIETNDHCGIAGASDCADCIRKACEKPIDACCAKEDCSATSILGDMDACGRGEVNACASTLVTGRLTKAEEDIRACAKTCTNSCTVGATTNSGPRPKWSCATAREPVNTCATCLYASCATALDSCCKDSSCRADEAMLNDLGACIAGDAFGCSYSQNEARSTSGQDGVVRACILEKCKTCFGEGVTHTSCTLLNGGKYCQCSTAEVSGDQPCSASSVGGSCVEGKDGCSCGAYSCSTTSSGCSCSFTGGLGDTLCRAPLGSSSSGSSSAPVCCVKLSDTGVSCECSEYNTKCYDTSDEYEVTSCDLQDVLALLQPVGRTPPKCSR